MLRTETTAGAIARSALVAVVLFALASCATLVDEIRIRTDPNTIVKPDVDELRELEMADGTYLRRSSQTLGNTGRGLDELLSERPPGQYGQQVRRPRRRDNYSENSTPIEPPAVEEEVLPYSVSEQGRVVPQAQAQAPAQGFGAPSPPEQPYLAAPIPTPSAPAPPPPLYDPSVIEELR